MKKLLVLFLAAACFLANAASDDIVFTLRNGTDTGQGPFTPAHPTTGIGLVQYDSGTHQPSWVNVGTGLTISSGILSATAATQINSDWNAVTGVAQIINRPLLASVATSGGQNCDVILEIASDSGFTANVQTIAISGTGQTYTLAVALQGVQPQTAVVSGFLPAGYYARLRTVSNTGSPAFSYRSGREVLL